MRNDAVDQAPGKGFLGVDNAAGQRHEEGVADAGDQGEVARAAAFRREAHFHEAGGELGLIGGDADIAGHWHREADPDGRPVDRCNDRLRAAQRHRHLRAAFPRRER